VLTGRDGTVTLRERLTPVGPTREVAAMAVTHPTQRRDALDAAYTPWSGRTVAQLLDHAADRFDDLPFVITDEKTFTYREMQQWVRRLAGGLVALGITPGDHVAVVLANYPEFVALKFAIARVGAVSVPVNFLLRERELSYVLQQSHTVALITMDRFRGGEYIAILDSLMPGWEEHGGGDAFPRLRNVVVFSAADEGNRARKWRSFSDLEGKATAETMAEADARSAAANPSTHSDILYTSGTTGSPKGVLLTHDMVVRAGYASAYGRGLSAGHRVAYSLPMYHVFGYIECLLAVSFVGGAVVPRLVFDPPDLLQSVSRHQVHEIACVPTMTIALLAEARANTYDLSTIQIMYSSGGPSAPSMVDEIREVFRPDEMVAGYGQTETTAAMTSTLPEDHDDALRYTNGRFRKAGAAGDPTIGGVLAVYKAVDVVTGADLPRGARGELVVRGPAVTAGYYDKPEETASAFDAHGWLRTGDIGIVGEDDSVVLVGRVKETYRCGGEMVMPKEVENVLMEHPGVGQAHVVGVAHPRMGEVGCAVIVAADPTDPPVASELIARCQRELARFKVPAHVVFLEAHDLPLTVTGRVQKFRLVELVTPLL
jgi:fatty-acyl-CoA synthase